MPTDTRSYRGDKTGVTNYQAVTDTGVIYDVRFDPEAIAGGNYLSARVTVCTDIYNRHDYFVVAAHALHL